MTIKGTVLSIIFRNAENGYTVMDFDADGSLITVVGFFPDLQEGESLALIGDYKENARYGQQFEATEVIFQAPTDERGIISYLSSGLFKGLGPVTAKQIVDNFGLRTLEIIENAPELLCRVKGIGKKRAEEIGETYRANTDMRATVIFLQSHGIPMGQTLRIYNVYGKNAIDKVTENPYSLVQDVEGIGFLTADRIAGKLGFDMKSEFRIMAAITYVLLEAAGKQGHTCLPESELVTAATELVGEVGEEKVEACITPMILSGRLKSYALRDSEGMVKDAIIALSGYYSMENAIAGRLVLMAEEARRSDSDFNLDKEIEVFEKENDIYLDDGQKLAVSHAVNRGATVITGGPGTGKTTIIKCIINLYKGKKAVTMLAAPTGRAAKRLSEATGEDAKTIHRLLGMEFSAGKPKFAFNELNLLPLDVLIVDEISMADVYIFSCLLKALPKGAKLVLVGDKDQLPSVSAGNVLADIIASDVMPVAYLKKIYRQDAESLIVYNAHLINEGEMPEINNSSKDFFLEEREDGEGILRSVISLVTERLPDYFRIKPSDIQVLSPVKRGTAGVENINKKLQEALNPVGKQVEINGMPFRVGDKVMHTVNNYQLEWTREERGRTEEGTGVFNGDVGYVTDIVRGELVVSFDDGRLVYYDRATQEDLTLAYAVSVHKAQGSEFSAVVIALPSGSGLLLNRNLLYTAVTRAKQLVVIVGSRANLYKMVKNDYTAKRYTLLKEFIWENQRKLKRLNGG